ncbi:MAG: ATP-binding protein [Lachnospiraceae bacterium]
MKKKIQNHLMIISTLAILSTMILTSVIFYDLISAQVFSEIRSYANILTSIPAVENYIGNGYHPEEDGIRITIIQADGTVSFDNVAAVTQMENHANRDEVVQAMESGEGKSVRVSATLQKATYYTALLLEDGSVLRVSKDVDSVFFMFVRVIPSILVITGFVILICSILAKILTNAIVDPIKKWANNLHSDDKKEIYVELKPFLDTIEKQHRDIIKAARLRQEFTANVSHELKTPLTSISGYAELIETGMATEENTMRFGKEIHKSANRLLTLINDILELSKLDSDAGESTVEPVDLYELANNCVQMLEFNAKKLQVSIEVEGSSAIVSGNKGMLEEVVFNLCDNATRYNKPGGKVVVTVIDRADTAVLKIIDDGIGISKQHQERVFERFYRVDKSRSKETGGTGLGLAIVKHIISLHHAMLELESEEGHGTQITITFMKHMSSERFGETK